MNYKLSAVIGALLLTGTAGVCGAAEAPGSAASGSATTALHCGHLIDVASGKLLGKTTVIIEAGLVKEVAAGEQTPNGAQAIDLSTQTCMPGLIDAHVHMTTSPPRCAMPSMPASFQVPGSTPPAKPSAPRVVTQTTPTVIAPTWPAIPRRCRGSSTASMTL